MLRGSPHLQSQLAACNSADLAYHFESWAAAAAASCLCLLRSLSARLFNSGSCLPYKDSFVLQLLRRTCVLRLLCLANLPAVCTLCLPLCSPSSLLCTACTASSSAILPASSSKQYLVQLFSLLVHCALHVLPVAPLLDILPAEALSH